MHEEELRRYFLGQRSVNELVENIRGSLVQVDRVHSTVRIIDMRESLSLTRLHLAGLCKAFLERTLSSEDLSIVAFALLASDTFEWDDDITSEVLSDWSAPEINYELNAETISMHQGWLLGSGVPPHREVIRPSNTTVGHLVSVRTKIST